jgi:hypothetical protein
LNKWSIFFTAAVLVITSAALPTAAQTNEALLHDIPVTGADEDDEPFTGLLSLYAFSYEDGLLRVNGMLTFDNPEGDSVAQTFENIAAELSYDDTALMLDLEPIYVSMLRTLIDLSVITFDLSLLPDRAESDPTSLDLLHHLAFDINEGESLSAIQQRIDDLNNDIQLIIPMETPEFEATPSP